MNTLVSKTLALFVELKLDLTFNRLKSNFFAIKTQMIHRCRTVVSFQ